MLFDFVKYICLSKLFPTSTPIYKINTPRKKPHSLNYSLITQVKQWPIRKTAIRTLMFDGDAEDPLLDLMF